jgi:hypothetical protein
MFKTTVALELTHGLVLAEYAVLCAQRLKPRLTGARPPRDRVERYPFPILCK